MSATITVKRSNLRIAPEGITFEVNVKGFDIPAGRRGGYNGRLHELHYIWDFGDPDQYTAPTNTVAEHKNANVAYGPLVAHVFKKAGTYTVSVRVIEPTSGKTATATYKVITADPDRVFAGAKTLFVDQRGDYSGAPAGSVGYSTLAAAVSAADNSGSEKRIMMSKGQIHNAQIIALRGNHPSLLFCAAPGRGAPPEIRWGPGQNNKLFWINDYDKGNSKDVSFSGLKLQGPWDSTTETGRADVIGVFIGTGAADRPSYSLMTDCELNGFSECISVPGGGPSTHEVQILHNTKITNWRKYGIYEKTQGYSALLGCEIAQDVNALSGGPANGTHNELGCIRIHIGGKFVMDGCDLFCRNGWFSNMDGWHTNQPCLRWNQSGIKGAVANIQRTSAEGGFEVFALTTMRRDMVPSVQNIIVDKCVLIGNFMSSTLIRVSYAGTTIRNSIFVHPNILRDISGIFNPKTFITLEDPGSARANKNGPVHIYNNTFINLMSPANTFEGRDGFVNLLDNRGFKNVVEENNVIHQPNLASPQTSDAPLNMTPLFPPRYKGYISFHQRPLKRQYATPADSVIAAIPQTGSAAIGDAIEGLAPINDFLGNQRPAYPSRGAREM